jgi:hypothetical protein
LGCFGRRRYAVFGTSTFGGFLGIGFLTRACAGFFFFTPSCYHSALPPEFALHRQIISEPLPLTNSIDPDLSGT